MKRKDKMKSKSHHSVSSSPYHHPFLHLQNEYQRQRSYLIVMFLAFLALTGYLLIGDALFPSSPSLLRSKFPQVFDRVESYFINSSSSSWDESDAEFDDNEQEIDHLQSQLIPFHSTINQHRKFATKDSQTFTLKHIYHHGTGQKNYKIHKRLDVTPQYLTKHSSHFTDFINAISQPREPHNGKHSPQTFLNLDEVYQQFDWPKVHRGKNPFTIELPIKKSPKLGIVQRLTERHTPNFIDTYLNYAYEVKGNPQVLNKINLEWDDKVEIEIPDMKDKNTIVSLATISSNAYVRFPLNEDEKDKSDWIDVGDYIPDENNVDLNFGWEDVGLRGHVFVSNDNKTIVIGIKGTSGVGLPGGGSDETGGNDKINDNLLFSCCCARVGYMWTTVCDCYEKAYTCNQDCLEKELLKEDKYYQAALDLYRNVTSIYDPNEVNIWVTGHSLGGAIASLLGRTYGIPAVAFEAPGEMLATKRLHLPQPPGIPKHLENIWHVGNTADPIYMGVCNGASSTCNVAGYAMETACHTGYQCVYDVVGDKGWRVNLLNHRIHTVIDDIILDYNETATCFEQPPCRDCFNWRFITHDDDEDDEPELPNPLRPRPKPKHSSSLSSSSSSNSNSKTKGGKPATTTVNGSSTSTIATTTETLGTGTSVPSDKPQKCLERTWYGWCTKWGDDDGDDGDVDGDV